MTPWSPEEVTILENLLPKGLSANQMAKILHRERGAVISKIHRAGLKDLWARSGRVGKEKSRKFAKKKTNTKPVQPVLKKEKISKVSLPPKLNPLDAPGLDPISLFDSQDCQCKYPIGEKTGISQIVCGAKKKKGPPYCEFHHSIAYKKWN